MSASFQAAISLGEIAPMYLTLRRQHPDVPARLAHHYARDAGVGLTFEQFVCEMTTGHDWSFTGSAYGGDDDSYHGEGRCYCSNCGADGDA